MGQRSKRPIATFIVRGADDIGSSTRATCEQKTNRGSHPHRRHHPRKPSSPEHPTTASGTPLGLVWLRRNPRIPLARDSSFSIA